MKFSVRSAQRPLASFAVLSWVVLLVACANTPPAINVLPPPSYADLMESADDAQRKGGAVESMGFYERAAKADPSKKQPWSRIAQAQFDARNYGAAITAAQEVLQRDTTDTTAKSIMAVSGLRVSANALEQLRQANALGGNTREEAQTLARIMRDALGESILPPAVAVPLPAVIEKPASRPAARRVAPAPVAAPTPTPAPASEPKRNPFDALKG